MLINACTAGDRPWQDTSLPREQRVSALLHTTLITCCRAQLSTFCALKAANGCSRFPAVAGDRPWQDTSLPREQRVSALLHALTLPEKLGLLDADKLPTGGVPRLGVPAFEGWNGERCVKCGCLDEMGLGYKCRACISVHFHAADS